MSGAKTILLVCTGNSCRSVMAWGLLKEMLKEKDDYKIITAGTGTIKGMPPTRETIQVMFEQNINVSLHRSQLINNEMLSGADLVLVMEKRHKEALLSRDPRVQNKVHLLSEFGRQESEDKLVDPDVPDPIGKPVEFYREILAIIKEALIRTVKKLEEQ